MRDAQPVEKIKFEFHGNPAEATKTFITERGDVYIGLFVKGCWVNVRAEDVKKYIKGGVSD